MSTLHILVADDIVLNQRILGGLLRKMGHAGVLVSDGQQVLSALKQQRFDLILMDASMPVLDGVGAAQEIRRLEREQPSRPRIPIIMVSGHVLPEDLARFRAAGADGFVPKPVQVGELQQEIRRVLGSS